MSDRPFTHPEAALGTDLVVPRSRRGWELVVALTTGRQEHVLEPPCELIVGRGEGASVVVDHGSVSRQHARITLREDATIEDLGSSNGTRLDGRLLQPGHAEYVRSGSVIELGDVMLLLRPPDSDAAAGASVHQQAGVSVEMVRALDLASAAAKSTLNVYVSGEAGSGRTWLAERIHRSSPRSGAPMVRVRLRKESADEEALASMSAAMPGAIERASGGVLLLQEPQHATKEARAILESALATRTLRRRDGTEHAALDVRVITTSTMSPKALKATGVDAELVARLSGITLDVPPLRLRRGEIRHLAEQALLEAPRRGMTFDAAAVGRLLFRDWIGNVAELREVVLRAASVAPGPEIRVEDVTFTRRRGRGEPRPPSNCAPEPDGAFSARGER